MSACDPRGYYPVVNGIFKLQASDGDLVWESFSISSRQWNTRVDKLPDGKITYGGLDSGAHGKLHYITESGGLISSVDVSGTSSQTFGSTGDQLFVGDHTDDYVYFGGNSAPPLGLIAEPLVIDRYDHSGNFQFSRKFSFTNFGIMRAVQGTQYVDVVNASFTVRIDRYDISTSGSSVLSFVSGGFLPITDRNNRILSDGSNYYCNHLGISKVSIATLAAGAAASPAAVAMRGEVRDGIMAAIGGNYTGGFGLISAFDTASMTMLFADTAAWSGRGFDCSACEDFVVGAGGDSTSSPTHATVKRFGLGGTVDWTVSLILSDQRAVFFDNETNPKTVISQDKDRVYVCGPFNNARALSASDLRIALYCLSASDGSILWRFSPGTFGRGTGSVFGNGLSLYDDGDYVYLGVANTQAPRYR